MAQVDFSSAVLDVNTGKKPITLAYYLFLNNYQYLLNSSGTPISSSSTKNVVSETSTKTSVLYAGRFDTSGTEFYLGNNGNAVWKVSNISFSTGDTYSFVVDIETSGST